MRPSVCLSAFIQDYGLPYRRSCERINQRYSYIWYSNTIQETSAACASGTQPARWFGEGRHCWDILWCWALTLSKTRASSLGILLARTCRRWRSLAERSSLASIARHSSWPYCRSASCFRWSWSHIRRLDPNSAQNAWTRHSKLQLRMHIRGPVASPQRRRQTCTTCWSNNCCARRSCWQRRLSCCAAPLRSLPSQPPLNRWITAASTFALFCCCWLPWIRDMYFIVINILTLREKLKSEIN